MREATCIDLRQFSLPYRCVNDLEGRPAYERDNVWDLVLPGAAGFVAPWGGDYLLACTRHRITTAAILAKVPGAVVSQDGSDGQNVRFHRDHLDLVAGVLRLYRRRQVSEAERARLAALGAATRFPPNDGVQSKVRAAPGEITAPKDPPPHPGPEPQAQEAKP
jgi:hypothetical protein